MEGGREGGKQRGRGKEEGRVQSVCNGTGQPQISTHTNLPLVIGVCTLTSQYITSSTVTLIVVLVITYPLQDRHTFLALLQTSPNLTSQYSVMEDELFELREREGGMVKEGERRGRGKSNEVLIRGVLCNIDTNNVVYNS